MKKIDFTIPKIFDTSKIIAGVTLKNTDLFPPHGFTVSQGDIADKKTVLAYRNILAEELGVDLSKMAFQKQVHGREIRIIDSDNNSISESDGMITSEKGMILSVSIADCAAILIYDPIEEIVAGIHSGWRGTQQRITQEAIKILINQFNSNPANLFVYISPAAGGDKYEVDSDVAELFPKSIKSIGNGKFLFDNKNEILVQLKDAGVKKENIEISPDCTISDEKYHSYRRDGVNSGRMSAFIGIKK